jgi:hypothetical protein
MKPDLSSPAYTPNRASKLIDLMRADRAANDVEVRRLVSQLCHNRRIRPGELQSILSQLEV